MRPRALMLIVLACWGCDGDTRPRGDTGTPVSDSGSDSATPDTAVMDSSTLSDAAVTDSAPGLDSEVNDSGVTDAMDASDAPSDGTSDAAPDAVLDGGCVDPTWGVSDDDTSDVAGDIFGTQTWTVDVCAVPVAGQRVPLFFRARITMMGTEFPFDYFGTGIWINGTGGYRDGLMTWTYVTITGSGFADYTLSLPADIDGDGTVDWTTGTNTIEIRTWSDYNARPSKSGLDSLRLGRP